MKEELVDGTGLMQRLRLVRVLLVASLVIALSGAFIAGAVLFRGDDDEIVGESQLRCEPVVETGGCGTLAYDAAVDMCRDSDPDAVKVTLILERNGREYDRRTTAWDCRTLLREELDRLERTGAT